MSSQPVLGCLCFFVVLATGCEKSSVARSEVGYRNMVAEQESTRKDDSDFWDVVQQKYLAAKAAGETTASSAAQWVGQLISQTQQTGTTATQESAEWVHRWYQTLRRTGMTSAENVTEWAIEDLRGQGTWEYQVISMSVDELTELQRKLDDLGSERWECFQIVPQGDSAVLFFKRSKRSYLGSIPIKEISQILPMLGDQE